MVTCFIWAVVTQRHFIAMICHCSRCAAMTSVITRYNIATSSLLHNLKYHLVPFFWFSKYGWSSWSSRSTSNMLTMKLRTTTSSVSSLFTLSIATCISSLWYANITVTCFQYYHSWVLTTVFSFLQFLILHYRTFFFLAHKVSAHSIFMDFTNQAKSSE
jgi:hypothetical protein